MARLDTERREWLETELMALDGVLHAAIDPRSGTDIWLVRDPTYHERPIELAVRNRLARLGHDPAGLVVRITMPVLSGPRRRVRFEGVRREAGAGQVAITVALRWRGEVHTGEAFADRGSALELKAAALATIRALESLSGESFGFRIIGVKSIHAFDSDLMVASLNRSAATEQRLVGTVVVADDPLAAAALAVLSALNRAMGNFLHTSD